MYIFIFDSLTKLKKTKKKTSTTFLLAFKCRYRLILKAVDILKIFSGFIHET